MALVFCYLKTTFKLIFVFLTSFVWQMTTGAERLEKIVTFLDKELLAFSCLVI